MKFFKSKLVLLILFLTIITLGLIGWGLAQSGSSKKEIEQYNAQIQQQLSALSKTSSSNQAQTVAPPSSNNASSSSSSQNQKSQTSSTSSSSSNTTSSLSDAAKQQATARIYALDGRLEGYQTQYGYYPSDISPSTFAGDGCMGDGCTSMFVPPSGVRFVYVPSPSGCTTAAKNCQHFTLQAVDSSGNVIIKKTSFN